MKDIGKIFKNSSPVSTLSEGFEDAVFAKIGRKKKQRKAAVSFAAGFFFAGLLYLGFTMIPSLKKGADPQLMADRSSRVTDRFKAGNEVPLTEDLYLTSTKQNTNYLVEKVSLEAEDGSF